MVKRINKVKVWSTELDDRPGAVSEKMRVLADAGADLQFVLARRQPNNPGKGLLFVSPIKGKKQEETARVAQLSETTELVGVRLEGVNKAGVGQRLTEAFSDAGINLRGLTASVIGTKFTAFIAFDNNTDADVGIKVLRKIK